MIIDIDNPFIPFIMFNKELLYSITPDNNFNILYDPHKNIRYVKEKGLFVYNSFDIMHNIEPRWLLSVSYYYITEQEFKKYINDAKYLIYFSEYNEILKQLINIDNINIEMHDTPELCEKYGQHSIYSVNCNNIEYISHNNLRILHSINKTVITFKKTCIIYINFDDDSLIKKILFHIKNRNNIRYNSLHIFCITDKIISNNIISNEIIQLLQNNMRSIYNENTKIYQDQSQIPIKIHIIKYKKRRYITKYYEYCVWFVYDNLINRVLDIYHLINITKIKNCVWNQIIKMIIGYIRKYICLLIITLFISYFKLYFYN